MNVVSAPIALACLCAACADSSAPDGSDAPTVTASCDSRASVQSCQEYIGSTSLLSYEGGCPTSFGSVWASTPCPRTDLLGGCRAVDPNGVSVTIWYYTGSQYGDAAAIENECKAQIELSYTYVAP